MPRKISFFLFAGLHFLSFETVFAADTPKLEKVEVVSQISYDKSTYVYTYTYQVSNQAANTGEIEAIDLDISLPSTGAELSSDGLVIEKGLSRKGRKLTTSFSNALSEIENLLKKRPLPVGGKAPAGWSADITVDGKFSWGVDQKKDQIKPGQKADGYIVESRGLPGIRDVAVRPDWVLVTDDVSEEDIAKSEATEKEITYYGKTLGPTAPPAAFDATAFLDYLINLKHDAASLGWVKNEGSVTSLDAKLDTAKKKISEGQSSAAKNILSAFINEVEAQGCATYENCPAGKHLTSEAYALLKYNAQYLIDNLR